MPNAIEEAVRLDAVAVCVNLMQLPGRPEIREANIVSIMALREQATRYGMPLMIEPLVMQDNAKAGGGYMVDGDTDKIVTLVRQARRARRRPHQGRPDRRRRRVPPGDRRRPGTCPCWSAEAAASTTARCSSARWPCSSRAPVGIVYGRNIIQHPNPAGITRALMAVLHDGADVETAPRTDRRGSMTPQTVNVAIVGGGLMGREIAAAIQRWPALDRPPGAPRLTAVCDINPAALDWFDQIPTVDHHGDRLPRTARRRQRSTSSTSPCVMTCTSSSTST